MLLDKCLCVCVMCVTLTSHNKTIWFHITNTKYLSVYTWNLSVANYSGLLTFVPFVFFTKPLLLLLIHFSVSLLFIYSYKQTSSHHKHTLVSSECCSFNLGHFLYLSPFGTYQVTILIVDFSSLLKKSIWVSSDS
jgi:hypothetical protein